MRIWGVLLSVMTASVVGGLGGHYLTSRQCHEEAARLTHERDLSLIRERELRAQLEDALTTRAALAQEAQQLQTTLSERLKRLEDIAARQLPSTRTESSGQE